MKQDIETVISIQPQFRTIDGLSIRFAESEDPGNNSHALLLCPWPESLYAFEPIWLQLSRYAHLIAVDLPGFGHSEYNEALMSPREMGKFIIRLADAFCLDHPHIVGPDIGTSAAVFAAATQPQRFRSLTVGSGGTMFPLVLDGILKEWIEAPDLEPYRRMNGRDIVASVLEYITGYTISDAARNDYLSAYEGEKFADSMRYVRAYPKELPVLAELLPAIKTPVLVFAGSKDAAVPVANAEFIARKLPNSKLAVLDTGHFVWEEGAPEFAGLIADWWTAGYQQF